MQRPHLKRTFVDQMAKITLMKNNNISNKPVIFYRPRIYDISCENAWYYCGSRINKKREKTH